MRLRMKLETPIEDSDPEFRGHVQPRLDEERITRNQRCQRTIDARSDLQFPDLEIPTKAQLGSEGDAVMVVAQVCLRLTQAEARDEADVRKQLDLLRRILASKVDVPGARVDE